jgi:hypothetical protein
LLRDIDCDCELLRQALAKDELARSSVASDLDLLLRLRRSLLEDTESIRILRLRRERRKP